MRTPFIIRPKFYLYATFLLATLTGQAQTILDEYISIGLQNNLVLEQKNISLERALLSLKIARGRFMPSVGLQGNYTTGEGGRSITFPVGDMLNPVYSTLNQLTGSDQFPQIENVRQNFFPKNFYDAKVRASMPLFNTDLVYNKKIIQQQVLLKQFEIDIYKRELVRDIKIAYFSYLSAREGMGIYESALTRAQEGKRVNESLLANGKGLPAYVLRSQSEIETIRAHQTDAERQAENAKLYFNFLLNRDNQSEIDGNFDPNLLLVQIPELLTQETDTRRREEIKQVQTLKDINSDALKMNQLFWSPRVSGFLDLGAQGENMTYNSQSNYYLLGFLVEVPLFAGFTNKNKIEQSRLDIKSADLTYTLTNRQLDTGKDFAMNKLITSYQNYLSAQKQLEAAQSYQKLIDKGYKEGVNTFIESIDARNQLTSAQFQVNINQYNVLIAEAGLERETASYDLNK
ncbi:MAG TPA: TolC family protein [Cyclobacteriaceae bacterium]|nr:TolC family protein [Cyclobacteriaceae bacterium]